MGTTTLYAGPDFFTDPSDTVDGIQASGFTTVVAGSLDIDGQGDLLWAGAPLVSGGEWAGDPAMLQNWPLLKGAGCSIETFMLGVGTPQSDDFSIVQSLSGSAAGALAVNIAALAQLLPALDGFDLSDAFMTSGAGMIAFCKLATANDLKISFNPASATTQTATIGYWQNVWSTWHHLNPGNVSVINLADFAGTDPQLYAQWAQALPNAAWVSCIPYISPALNQGRCPDSYTGMLGQMNDAHPLVGGAMYLYDDFVDSPPPWPHCQMQGGQPCYLPDYAAAITAAP